MLGLASRIIVSGTVISFKEHFESQLSFFLSVSVSKLQLLKGYFVTFCLQNLEIYNFCSFCYIYSLAHFIFCVMSSNYQRS